MKRKIIIPIIITFGFILLVNTGFSQTSASDTTKQKKKIEQKKSARKDKDTTSSQNKITVNEDGVMVRKKVTKETKTQEVPKKEKDPELKNNEKTVEPKKED
jgi:hypothetical protein